MAVPTRIDRTAVAARTESGQLCTVTVQRDPLGLDLLRYEGSETTAAELTPEVVELLTVALSVRGRSAISAQSPQGGACTLLVIGHQDGRTPPVLPRLHRHECRARYHCQRQVAGGTGIAGVAGRRGPVAPDWAHREIWSISVPARSRRRARGQVLQPPCQICRDAGLL